MLAIASAFFMTISTLEPRQPQGCADAHGNDASCRKHRDPSVLA